MRKNIKCCLRIAAVLNILLIALFIITFLNCLFFIKDEHCRSSLHFLLFTTRTATLRGSPFTDEDFNTIENGMNSEEVENRLGTPLESDAISENGMICLKKLRALPHNQDGGLTQIHYDNADKTCSPAYEVWKYTQPDPREKSYDVREIKFKSGRVVGKVMRFQK